MQILEFDNLEFIQQKYDLTLASSTAFFHWRWCKM